MSPTSVPGIALTAVCRFPEGYFLENPAVRADGSVLVADCSATASIWLAHDTMKSDPDSAVAPPPQPGVNGVRFGPRTGYLSYTSTAQTAPPQDATIHRPALLRAEIEPAGPADPVAG